MSNQIHNPTKNWIKGINISQLEILVNSNKGYGYREFCRMLNIPICSSGSNSQLKQLKQLSTLCEMHKEQHKYYFLRIRKDTEIYIYDKRSKYKDLIGYCLLEYYLTKQNTSYMIKDWLFCSNSQLLQWCGMVHPNFINYLHATVEEKQLICIKYSLSSAILDTFVNHVYYKMLIPLLHRVLTSLNKHDILVLDKGFKVYNKSQYYYAYRNILPNSRLGACLNFIIQQSLDKIGITKEQNLFTISESQRLKFYHTCNELCQLQLGYTGFYPCYIIKFMSYFMRFDLFTLKTQLNKHTQDKILTTSVLKTLRTQERQQCIDWMVDLNTTSNFHRDILQYRKQGRKKNHENTTF